MRRCLWICSSSVPLIKTWPLWVIAPLSRYVVFFLRYTSACLPHYTSGQTYFYPAFNARTEDAVKFAHEFGSVLAQPIMLEAVMRVRASKSEFHALLHSLLLVLIISSICADLRMSSFHGNFFVRSTDLLAMPAVPQDLSYAIEVQIEDTITAPFVVFQTAVLHTTCYGTHAKPFHFAPTC